MEILKAEQISKRFGDKEVLQNVSLTLNAGEIVGVLGVSGGGKTTLFNVLSGVCAPDGGRVLLRGEDVTGKPGKVSYMLQKDLLFPYRRVVDNVCLPLTLRGMSRREARAAAEPYFEPFGLAGTQTLYPAQLSGGMRQRAAFLRTYLASDGVALLDEPFSALDAITKRTMHKWYLGVMRTIELSVLLITHDVDEAILLCDRVYILSGKPGEIRAQIRIDKEKTEDFALSTDFLDYKRQILAAMHLD
ncbi:MAG: ABC transporter ATP-binding protein [Clostridia bacterium]|nr:ABC transporter ATP-binding protein [Clostridia bacterium]